jgi:opacity protein-like surface antigen
MKKLTCVLAILAAASTAAAAKDLKQDNKALSNAPAASATQMNDAEMDKVTAGQGFGVGTAEDHGANLGFSSFGLGIAGGHAQSPAAPGHGVCTAGRCD